MERERNAFADRPEHERTAVAVRSALGEEAFAAGRALSLEQAVTLALEEEASSPSATADPT